MKKSVSSNTSRRVARILIAILILIGFIPPHPVRAQEDLCQFEDLHVSLPLTALGNHLYVRMDGQKTTFTGGLYPHGINQPPANHAAAALALAQTILPLNPDGQPDPVRGLIVMTSVGMSNTSHEFHTFIDLAQRDGQVNQKLRIVSGALGGQTAERWIDPDGMVWELVNANLRHAKVTPAQVQVAWVKQTHTLGGDFPHKAQALQADLEQIARNLHRNYPNLKLVYFSSRTRSYTYGRGLSPEPNAFETGFAVKWMIEKQIAGDPSLNYDPGRGEVVAPLLLWGPYLWIDGGNPRQDGRVWLAQDMTGDCTHPSTSGKAKVAEMLLEFFHTDPTAQGWFLAEGAAPASVATTEPGDRFTKQLWVLRHRR